MKVTINDCALNVEVMGPEDGPVLIEERDLFLSTVRDFLEGAL
jgi:hypothetical protein